MQTNTQGATSRYSLDLEGIARYLKVFRKADGTPNTDKVLRLVREQGLPVARLGDRKDIRGNPEEIDGWLANKAKKPERRRARGRHARTVAR